MLSDHCIRRPVMTLVLSILIIVLGLMGYSRIPVRGFHNMTVPPQQMPTFI